MANSITVGQPHRRATSNAMARRIKQELADVGIDAAIYAPHSRRSATSSKGMEIGITDTEILKYQSKDEG